MNSRILHLTKQNQSQLNTNNNSNEENYDHQINQIHNIFNELLLTKDLQTNNNHSDHYIYYPCIALKSLVLILIDNGLRIHYSEVISIIIQIMHRLGSKKSKPFLPMVIPSLSHNTKLSKDEIVRKPLISLLSALVRIVGNCIRDQIHIYWISSSIISESRTELLKLIRCISNALGDEFKVYLTDIIPLLLNALHTDKSIQRIPTINVLKSFEIFGSNLEDHLFLIIIMFAIFTPFDK